MENIITDGKDGSLPQDRQKAYLRIAFVIKKVTLPTVFQHKAQGDLKTFGITQMTHYWIRVVSILILEY